MAKKIKLSGLPPIPVVSDKEAEEVDYLVCVAANKLSPFPDNLTGFCFKCGVKIQFRWHAPRKPRRICIDCMLKQVEGEPP